MKFNPIPNSITSITFRKVKTKLYAWKWFYPNDYIPVNTSKDTEKMFCVQLSPSISFMVDKNFLYDYTKSILISPNEYKSLVESDWDKNMTNTIIDGGFIKNSPLYKKLINL